MKRTEELVTVTPGEAGSFLESNSFEGQRKLSETRVDEYAEKMEDGRFHVGNVAIVDDRKRTYLVDGQHQCKASVKSGKPFRAVVQRYTAEKGDGKAALAHVFSQFNVDYARTIGQIAWQVGAISGMADWPRPCVTICCSALSMMHGGGFRLHHTNRGMSKDQRAELLIKNRKACEFIRDVFYTGATKKKLVQRAPVVAAAIATFKVAGPVAREFWDAVISGEMLAKSDQRYRLREYLLNSVIRSSGVSGARSVKPREMYAKCIHAWNAWVDGIPSKAALKYYAKASLPEAKKPNPGDFNGSA